MKKEMLYIGMCLLLLGQNTCIFGQDDYETDYPLHAAVQ
jgi:hypothetical protein